MLTVCRVLSVLLLYYYLDTINKETKCLRYKASAVGRRYISRPSSRALPKAADFFRLAAI